MVWLWCNRFVLDNCSIVSILDWNYMNIVCNGKIFYYIYIKEILGVWVFVCKYNIFISEIKMFYFFLEGFGN